MLLRFNQNGFDNILFSDEKLITIEPVCNQQNDRILTPTVSAIPSDIRIISYVHLPKSVMFWPGISAENCTSLVFVHDRVKINSETYIKSHFESNCKESWSENVSWSTVDLSTEQYRCICSFITKDEWLPSSPDLNPLDFSVWGILESKVGASSHGSIEALKKAFKRE